MSDERWIIMKASRSVDDLTVGPSSAYRGPATERAGVEAGKVYTDRKQAERDAWKLAACNPVGFHVVRIR